jgi:hypothetical protein
MTLTELDRLTLPPSMGVCPVRGSDQVHGQACIATRLFRTIARIGNRKIRRAEIPVVDAAFLQGVRHRTLQFRTLKAKPRTERHIQQGLPTLRGSRHTGLSASAALENGPPVRRLRRGWGLFEIPEQCTPPLTEGFAQEGASEIRR